MAFFQTTKDTKITKERLRVLTKYNWKALFQRFQDEDLFDRPAAMTFTIESEQGVDGRWLAEILEISEVMAYGDTLEPFPGLADPR